MRLLRSMVVLIAFAGLFASGCAANLDGLAPAAVTNEPTGQVVGQSQTTGQRTAAGDPLKVAIIVPSQGFGRSQLIGKGLKQAAELALFDANDQRVQLVAKNDDGSPGGSATAAREAMSDGAELILGPLFGASVSGIAELARPAGVPLLSFSNDRSVAGSGVYLMSVLPEQEVETITGFAIGRGLKTFAALIPAGNYGDALELAFGRSVAAGGGRVVALERYEAGTNAMLGPAKRVFDIVAEAARMGAAVDAIFLPATRASLPVLASQMAIAGVDPGQTKVLGIGAWDDPHAGRDKMLLGAWYPGLDPGAWDAFAERFGRTFGSAPPRIAIHAYDSMRLAIALADGEKGQRYSQARLTMPQGFEGAAGRFRLMPDGTTRRELAVLEVLEFGVRRIDRGAPVSQREVARSPQASREAQVGEGGQALRSHSISTEGRDAVNFGDAAAAASARL